MTKWGWKNQITEGNLRKWKWNKAIISRRIQRGRNKKRWKKDIQEIMNTGAWRGEQRDRIWQSKLRLSYRLWPGRQRQSHDGHWQLFADRCEICWMLNRPLMLFCVFICLCCFSSLTIHSISPQLPTWIAGRAESLTAGHWIHSSTLCGQKAMQILCGYSTSELRRCAACILVPKCNWISI